MSEEGKDSHHHHHYHHHHHEESEPPPVAAEYGTFEPPPQPVVGLPQPVPPPGALEPSEYYARGYQSVPDLNLSYPKMMDVAGPANMFADYKRQNQKNAKFFDSLAKCK